MSECTTFVYPFTYGRTSWGKFWQLWIKLHFIWFYFLSFFLAYYTIVISGCPRVCKIHWQLIQVSCQINTTLLHKEYLCTQLQLTLCNPINCSPSSSSVHGISQQEYWSGLPFPLLGDLPHLGIEPVSCMAGSSFSVESLIKPLQVPYNNKIFLISLSVPWITAAIHFTYSVLMSTHMHTQSNTLLLLIWTHQLNQLSRRKIKGSTLCSLIPLLYVDLIFWHTIFFPYEEFLTFPVKQIYWQLIP